MSYPDLPPRKNFRQKKTAVVKSERRKIRKRKSWLEPVQTGLRTCTAPTVTLPSTIGSTFRIIAGATDINIPSCPMKVETSCQLGGGWNTKRFEVLISNGPND